MRRDETAPSTADFFPPAEALKRDLIRSTVNIQKHLQRAPGRMLHVHCDAFVVRGRSGKYEAPDILQFITGVEVNRAQQETVLSLKVEAPPSCTAPALSSLTKARSECAGPDQTLGAHRSSRGSPSVRWHRHIRVALAAGAGRGRGGGGGGGGEGRGVGNVSKQMRADCGLGSFLR